MGSGSWVRTACEPMAYAAGALLALCLPQAVMANTGAVTPYQEYSKVVNSTEMLGALDGGMFGDKTGLYNGSTEFVVTDINLPGNNALPVRLGRRLKIESREYTQSVGGFGIWDLDIPYVHGVFDSNYKWSIAGNGATARCSQFWLPKTHHGALIGEVWSGNHLYMPGSGDQEILRLTSEHVVPSGAGAVWGTRDNFRFACVSSMRNGYPGEGFVAISPEGVRYTFDVGVERMAPSMDGGRAYYVTRTRVLLLPSRIEDVHGNWVEFTYAGNQLTRIRSNDGRQIDLHYSGNEIVRVTAHGREWHYQYFQPGFGQGFNNIREAMLTRVVLPDTSEWSIAYTGALDAVEYLDTGSVNVGCPAPGVAGPGAARLTFVHPSGATGRFDFGYVRHYRSGIPETCMPLVPDWWDIPDELGGGRTHALTVPEFFDSHAILDKRIHGPGIEPMQWSYDYGVVAYGRLPGDASVPCTTCASQKTVAVTLPDGRVEESVFGVLYQRNDGRLLGSTTRDSSGVERQTREISYVTDAEHQAMPFPDLHGGTSISGTDPSSLLNRPIRTQAILQDGATFTWHADTFDTFARPLSLTKSSTLPGNPGRVEVTQYYDNLGKWVLGQVSQVMVDGVVASETSYNANAQPTISREFGRTVQTLGYDTTASIASGQRGTVRTVADGNGNVTMLSSWKRGIPKSIQHPATPEAPSGATQAAVVNDHGWVTRVSDENGFQTNYQYDLMGRLSRIGHPAGDAVSWNPTTFSLTKATSSAYGIPAGHWQHTSATRNGRKVTYLDALWRPLLVREYDTENVGSTQRFTRQVFDHDGRVIFVSYPSASGTPATGTWTEYDTLGRPTSVSQDSELGLLTSITQYLSGFQVRTTSPKGQQTTTRYLAWDQPTTGYPVGITHPGGAFTDIARDAFGKPTALTRRNSNGTVSLTRSYVYDSHQQLCKSVEPETGATIMAYDAAGNLAWSRAGATQTGTTSCNTGNVPVAQRTVRSYDARNRIQSLTFPDNLGNTTYAYTPDGLLSQITVDNGGAGIVSTAYTYNRRRMPVGEAVGIGAHQWSIGYGYDANGHLHTHILPGGLVVDYAPNALGQPTKAGSYATGAIYFPNGSLRQFTYGNNIVRTYTQNARGLPERTRDAYGGSAFHDDSLDYDQHGNVAAISDGLTGNRGDRTMSYDALDRLTGTVSPMFGTATYTYDVLDNLRTVRLTSGPKARNHTYGYDAAHQLTSVTNTSGGATVASLAYDAQGNLASRNGRVYDFDHGNRLRNVAGLETYLYDAHGRRVQAIRNGASIYSIYGQDGVLRYQRDERIGKATEYVHFGGSLVAQLEDPISLATPTLTAPGYSSNGNYVVTWTASAHATRYQLQERLGSGSWATVHDAAGTSRAVSGKAAGSWGYRVRACSATSCGSWSATVTVSVQLPPAAAPSLNVPANGFNGAYTVTWGSVASASKYQLQERQGTGSWATVHDAAGTSLAVSGKAAGNWGYRVRACNDAGCGGWSSTGTVAVLHMPGAAPVLTVPATNTTGGYTVSWASVATAARYELQERLGSGSWSLIHNAGGTSRAVSGKTTGSWGYRIRACNDAGCSGYSPVATVAVTRPPTAAPALTVPASNNSGSYAVSWTVIAHAARYELQERLGTGNWSLIQDAGVTSRTLTGKGTGSWGYRVRACNAAGCGGYSAVSTVAVALAPSSAPTLQAPADSGTGDYTVSWSAVAEAARYELQERKGGGAWAVLQNTSARTFSVLSNAPGTYDYRVRGCNDVGCAGWSAIGSTTVSAPPLAAPVLAVPTYPVPLHSGYQVQWSSVAGTTQYELHEQTYPSGQWSPIYTGAHPWFSLFAAEPGVLTYRVRACNAQGCGAFSQPRNVTVEAPTCSYPPCIEW